MLIILQGKAMIYSKAFRYRVHFQSSLHIAFYYGRPGLCCQESYLQPFMDAVKLIILSRVRPSCPTGRKYAEGRDARGKFAIRSHRPLPENGKLSHRYGEVETASRPISIDLHIIPAEMVPHTVSRCSNSLRPRFEKRTELRSHPDHNKDFAVKRSECLHYG